MIVAVIGFIGFMVYAIVVRHSLHGAGIFLYLGILGAVMVCLNVYMTETVAYMTNEGVQKGISCQYISTEFYCMAKFLNIHIQMVSPSIFTEWP